MKKLQRKVGSTFTTMLGTVVVTKFMSEATTEDEYQRWVAAQLRVQALTQTVAQLRDYLEGRGGAPGDALAAEEHLDAIKAAVFEAIAIRKVEADRRRKVKQAARVRRQPKRLRAAKSR